MKSDGSATKKLSPKDWPAKLLRPRHLALSLVQPPPKAAAERLPDLDSLCELCLDGKPHPHV
jgi:hypothetical protein